MTSPAVEGFKPALGTGDLGPAWHGSRRKYAYFLVLFLNSQVQYLFYLGPFAKRSRFASPVLALEETLRFLTSAASLMHYTRQRFA